MFIEHYRRGRRPPLSLGSWPHWRTEYDWSGGAVALDEIDRITILVSRDSAALCGFSRSPASVSRDGQAVFPVISQLLNAGLGAYPAVVTDAHPRNTGKMVAPGCSPRTCGETHRRTRQPVSISRRICDVLALFPSLVPPWLLYLLCGRRWPRHQRRLVRPSGSRYRATRYRGPDSPLRSDNGHSAPQAARQCHDHRGLGGHRRCPDGPDGKLFVDAGITGTRPRILEAVNNLSRDPIKHLINTHWHFDHTDGNQWLNEQGAAILAHKRLQLAMRVEDSEYNFPAPPLAAVPSEVFASEKTLNLNRSTLHLKYYGPAHTDSDISVTFTEADILHCGDTFWNGFYPFIDYSSGGSIDGMIKAAEANVAAVSDKTIVIPGHNMPGHASPVSNKTELASFHDMLVAIRTNVAKLKQQGRSLDETTAAKPTAAFDAKWGQFLITPAFFTKLVYEDV
jgi:glyoxylase-like metal-dependent hydrolase (beta-lactamase superfamily II)